MSFCSIHCVPRFLSTPSARRATRHASRCFVHKVISIHALREEGDPSVLNSCVDLGLFLSTPSARRATRVPSLPPPLQGISIHALREEGDCSGLCKRSSQRYFYPRPPRGGRHTRAAAQRQLEDQDFYPRPPRGGRPVARKNPPLLCHFYPRPPRGGRRRWTASAALPADFYPRPPRGGRHRHHSG